jgi:hypothetical protein
MAKRRLTNRAALIAITKAMNQPRDRYDVPAALLLLLDVMNFVRATGRFVRRPRRLAPPHELGSRREPGRRKTRRL